MTNCLSGPPVLLLVGGLKHVINNSKEYLISKLVTALTWCLIKYPVPYSENRSGIASACKNSASVIKNDNS